MSICEHCGADKPATFDSAGLYITDSPPSFMWRGEAFHLSRREYEVLLPLVRRGRVSHESLEYDLFLEAEDAANVVNVYIHKLRRRLAAAGCPHQIVTKWGWGYELKAA